MGRQFQQFRHRQNHAHRQRYRGIDQNDASGRATLPGILRKQNAPQTREVTEAPASCGLPQNAESVRPLHHRAETADDFL